MPSTSGRAKRLEGIEIRLADPLYAGSVQYRTHVQSIGWQGWVSDGAMSGTSGQAKRLEAIQIRLTGTMASKYDVWYRVHAQNFGWMGWARNGASAGTEGYAYRLEAIEIRLTAKGAAAPGPTGNAFSKYGSFMTLKGKYYNWSVDLPSYWKGKVDVHREETHSPKSSVVVETYTIMPKGYAPRNGRVLGDRYLLCVSVGPLDGYLNYDQNIRNAKLMTGQTVRLYHEDDNGQMRFYQKVSGHYYIDVSVRNYRQSFFKSTPLSLADANKLADLQTMGRYKYSSNPNDDTVPYTCLSDIAARTSVW